MNGKSFVGAVVKFALAVGLLIVVVVFGTHRLDGQPPTTKQAVITVKSGTTCEQTVIGVGVSPLPDVSKKKGESIEWTGATAGTHVILTFQNTHGLPFRKGKLNEHENSGIPIGKPGNYNFQSINVVPPSGGPVSCSNAQTMGVHVRQ